MTNFFIDKKTYKERLDICRECVYYFEPTGQCKRCLCFMKIKASISVMECPEKYWMKAGQEKKIKDIPEHLIEEVMNIWDDVKTGKAKNQKVKRKMIELWNTISGSRYKTSTNCGSCLNNCYEGIKNIYNKYA